MIFFIINIKEKSLKDLVKILVLDDDSLFVKEIGELLSKNGFDNYKLFTNPDEMLNDLSKDTNVCIIDYKLNHVMTGMDVIVKVKEIIPSCYFIMISALEDFDLLLFFDHTTIRGHYIVKNRRDTNKLIITFINEFMNDMITLLPIYAQMNDLVNKLDILKNKIKGDKNVA